MKILVTGINAMEAREPKRGYKINTSVVAVVDTLRKKHAVEQRPLEPGESLEKYDRVVVYPATIGGFSSGFALGAFYAAAVAGERLILALDDWQTATVRPSIVGFLKNLDKNLAKTNFFHRADEWAKHRSTILEGAGLLCESISARPLMAPTFYGEGNLDDLGFPCGGEKFAFDPSGWFADFYKTSAVVDSGDIQREEKWISSSLVNRAKWLAGMRDSRWPIESYGSKAAGDERVPEAELVNAKYTHAWGVLAPPTGLPSGLWWRARYQHAAEAGAIIAGDPAETSFCGEAYAYAPEEIERWGLGDLRKLRDLQQETYFAKCWPKQKLVKQLNAFVESCVQ